MKAIAGKAALITGGSSGIGLALAKQMAAGGANLTLLGRDPSKLQAACEEITPLLSSSQQQVHTISADVSDGPALSAALAEHVSRYGTPDILVNCAGIAHPGLFHESEPETFRREMEVNYLGTVFATRAIVPGMIARRSGHIVNISSIVGFLGIYGYSAYAGTKFAVRGFSDSIRYELEEHGITVTVVFPPDTQTPQLDYENTIKPAITKFMDENNKVMTADAVAKSILNGIARKKHYVTPGFDSSFYWFLVNLVGGLVHPVMNILLADARRKARAAEQHR